MNIMNNKLTNSKQTGIIAVSLVIVLMGVAAWFMGYTGRQSGAGHCARHHLARTCDRTIPSEPPADGHLPPSPTKSVDRLKALMSTFTGAHRGFRCGKRRMLKEHLSPSGHWQRLLKPSLHTIRHVMSLADRDLHIRVSGRHQLPLLPLCCYFPPMSRAIASVLTVMRSAARAITLTNHSVLLTLSIQTLNTIAFVVLTERVSAGEPIWRHITRDTGLS